MFGFKLVRRSKQDEKQSLEYKTIVVDLYETLNNIYDKLKSTIMVGDMEGCSLIGEHIKHVDSLLMTYNLNKFSSPSTFLSMQELLKAFVNLYKRYYDAHSAMRDLTHEVLKYQHDMTFHPENFDKDVDDSLKRKVDLMYKDSENIMTMLVPEMVSYIIALRTAIGSDKYKVIHDIDIIDDYYKRMKMKQDGTKYQISFKMVDTKDDSKNHNKTKEDKLNGILEKKKEKDSK